MKYLGIDYGSKRVGLAVSDENGLMSFPLAVLQNSEDLVDKIAEICKEKGVGEIVVGESFDFNMRKNEIMSEIEPFVGKLEEKTKLPVRLHPEFLTSAEAEKIQGKNDMLDASAAAIILKSFLESKNNFKNP